MPTLIKRYSNRKLYDTLEKQYITLEKIAELIRQGGEVQVVDNASGEDLTAVTLTQIIFEQEKKQAGFLPPPLLARLVQAGGETMEAILRRMLLPPLELAHQADFDLEQAVSQALGRHGIATRQDTQALLEQLDSLGQQVDRLASRKPS